MNRIESLGDKATLLEPFELQANEHQLDRSMAMPTSISSQGDPATISAVSGGVFDAPHKTLALVALSHKFSHLRRHIVRPCTAKRLREDEDEGADGNEREDTPRFSQWVPEEELDAESDAESGSGLEFNEDSEEEEESDSGSTASSDGDSDSDTDSGSEPETTSTKSKPEWATAKPKARKQRAPWETIESLERALKRESAIEKAKREERERAALEKVKKEEKEKRQGGKGAWFMKKSEKRELLLKAKFDDLAASGGQNAVRKAIDKRKKKITQKEKRPGLLAKPKLGLSRRVAGLAVVASQTQVVVTTRSDGASDQLAFRYGPM
ncbi:rRNA biogenesis protein RRP36 [Rhizoctonia solani]|uniref:rRNA biogenesis protein RRP36 n=1 Tax=Rhizoctonia solani TaxID=456999 RepID=A0A8H7M9A9_9AGAM|nr:rRNA biogenesis protein RRP36 [Rhizoctonia solani]